MFLASDILVCFLFGNISSIFCHGSLSSIVGPKLSVGSISSFSLSYFPIQSQRVFCYPFLFFFFSLQRIMCHLLLWLHGREEHHGYPSHLILDIPSHLMCPYSLLSKDGYHPFSSFLFFFFFSFVIVFFLTWHQQMSKKR